ncbi:MAG TPA: zinc-binding alcohol dehydrogenase family protein [Ideonella sp.]|uniref:quinone oxidoreductase family protein n=1 Tax=Ideonella sp. TaxID=1929293 RepID=UPI002D133F70|nr:zinc-binding alcohol dehydrogenase family protein [Ideonella sp.]HSI48090.1 zinc-binding alcohol dehydrogenase family protein [Ideonella sp.]
MKAAIVTQAGQAPVFGDFETPVASPGKQLIRVTASAISHVTRGRASGKHYSASGALPLIPGVDGTGLTEDGQRVYFLMPEHPYGAMAEHCLVDAKRLLRLPDGLADETAAAMVIPAMSSWAALAERAQMRAGETVWINGATGASGRLAIQVAKHLGAKKVIATARNTGAFDDLRRLGADVTIALTQDRETMAQAFQHEFAQGVDIVLDYLWGTSAETLIVAAAKASPDGLPVRFVQIGAISGADIALPAAALRSTALQLMGSGIGSVPMPRLFKAIQGVLAAAPAAGFEIATRVVPLAEVGRVWADDDSASRIVLRP